MGLFYEGVNIYNVLLFLFILLCSILIYKLSSYNLLTGIVTYLVIPILLLIVFITNVENTYLNDWFHIFKLISVLIACYISLAMRYSKRIQNIKGVYILPSLILIINIAGAIIKELTIFYGNEYISGIWNYFNITSGIILCITLVGWSGIYITETKSRNMVWNDMTWYWIIGYNLWNYTYSYNVYGNLSFYSLAILLSATYLAFREVRGVWLQYRAYTLAISYIALFTVPSLLLNNHIVVYSSSNNVYKLIISIITLIVCISTFIYRYYTLKRSYRCN